MSRSVVPYAREKKITVGHEYMEVDIFSRDPEQDRVARRGTRNKKTKVSSPAQQNLNDKNAKRYLTELANGNFEEGDLWVTLTYKDEFLPQTVEEGENRVRNFLRRLARRRKRDGLEPLKYILVSEYPTHKDGTMGRIHHHLLINQMDWKIVKQLWSEKRRLLGSARIEPVEYELDPEHNHMEGIVKYMTKEPCGKKRWSSSRNLVRPVARANDWKYRRSKVARLAQDRAAAFEYFASQYPEWELVPGMEMKCNPVTGEWSVYLKMWRRMPEEVVWSAWLKMQRVLMTMHVA